MYVSLVKTRRYASAGISAYILRTRSRSCWPKPRTSFGRGTSPRFGARSRACTSALRATGCLQPLRGGDGPLPRLSLPRWPRILVLATCARQNVRRDQLVLHSDRGPVMTSKTYVQLLAELGVEGSYSRPYRSNDNPYSEAHFRTAKYHRTYEVRFGSLEDARSWARQFFQWVQQRILPHGDCADASLDDPLRQDGARYGRRDSASCRKPYTREPGAVHSGDSQGTHATAEGVDQPARRSPGCSEARSQEQRPANPATS